MKTRRILIFISFLLFPVTIWYFSPYLIIRAMSRHIMNGSFCVFMAMLVTATFAGRAWCGYLCPGGGLQECCAAVNDRPAKQGRRDSIKYVIWCIWIIGIIVTFIMGKNDVTVDFFYMTDHGISVAGIYDYIVYYGVLFILVAPSLIHGKRAACHYICWMAPFLVIGSSIGRLLHIPQLHIEADRQKCISCKKCSRACPMGLDVEQMVRQQTNAACTECIQCGECIRACPKHVLQYKMTWRNK
jgi:ferredoxin-type protein NapH